MKIYKVQIILKYKIIEIFKNNNKKKVFDNLNNFKNIFITILILKYI